MIFIQVPRNFWEILKKGKKINGLPQIASDHTSVPCTSGEVKKRIHAK